MIRHIGGTLELTSKVRYGMTSRGVPLFRFIPYDKRFAPLAVGCSQRDLMHNIHAIVEPQGEPKKGELQRANIIKSLGRPTEETELQLLIATYAQDSKKEKPLVKASQGILFLPARTRMPGITFHIDPPGCKDVDDSFTVYKKDAETWIITINIADVSYHVQEDSPLDTFAKERSTSFYTPEGEAVYPMLPKDLEEIVSLLPGSSKLSVSISFTFSNNKVSEVGWYLTETCTNYSYTYDQADKHLEQIEELFILKKVCESLYDKPCTNSHEIVERLMIFYNEEAGHILKKAGAGILRRHKDSEKELHILGVPEFLVYEAAQYCLATDTDTRHHGLSSDAYAYASSPIRRYADLVNQRSIKKLINGETPNPSVEALVEELNRRQKQAKAFQRDLFFMKHLKGSSQAVEGIVTDVCEKTKIWVPAWKRRITSKSTKSKKFQRGEKVLITWYENREQPRWKDRIVFDVNENKNLVLNKYA